MQKLNAFFAGCMLKMPLRVSFTKRNTYSRNIQHVKNVPKVAKNPTLFIFPMLLQLCQWSVCCILWCREYSQRPPQGMGIFFPLSWHSTVAAPFLERWIGLGPEFPCTRTKGWIQEDIAYRHLVQEDIAIWWCDF